jgi:hypothetical protein
MFPHLNVSIKILGRFFVEKHDDDVDDDDDEMMMR